jgi:hypothetical protein
MFKTGFGVGVGVGVDVGILRRILDGRTNVFVGVTVDVIVGVGVNVTEGPGVTVEVISELSVAATVGSKVMAGVRLAFGASLSPPNILLDLVPKKYEDTPIRIASSNRATTIITFFLTRRTLLLIFSTVNSRYFQIILPLQQISYCPKSPYRYKA